MRLKVVGWIIIITNFNLPLYHILGACPASQLLQDLLKVHFQSEWIFPIFSLNVYDKKTTFKTYIILHSKILNFTNACSVYMLLLLYALTRRGSSKYQVFHTHINVQISYGKGILHISSLPVSYNIINLFFCKWLFSPGQQHMS